MVTLISISFANAVLAENAYLSVDPLGTKTIGDLAILSGETNLPEGTELSVRVEEAEYNSGTVVVKGNNSVNRWYVPVDTWGIKPGTYIINVTEVTGYNLKKTAHICGDTHGNTTVILNGTFLGSEISVPARGQEHAFITLDPIPNKKTGDLFLITGKTNLSVGTDIIWEVSPTILDTGVEITNNTNLSGIMANSQVTKGSDTNRVSLALNTYELNPDEYNVSVATIKGDIFSPDMEFGNVTDSANFTLK
jgi:hypothetical protein